ncbi:uncharacterized protein LOC144441460 isoform X2 [Glandiceps talaboti]
MAFNNVRMVKMKSVVHCVIGLQILLAHWRKHGIPLATTAILRNIVMPNTVIRRKYVSLESRRTGQENSNTRLAAWTQRNASDENVKCLVVAMKILSTYKKENNALSVATLPTATSANFNHFRNSFKKRNSESGRQADNIWIFS